MEAPKKKLDFENPPIEEVVLSILFRSLNSLLAPHLGEIWQDFKQNQFAQIVERPPVPPVVEKFPNPVGDPELRIGNAPELPRIWFVHKDQTEIIQVQRDRFTFNWRRTDSDQKYPGFSTICNKFNGFYNRFCQIIKDMEIGEVTPLQYELTYIDQIRQGDGWNTLNDIGRIYNLFSNSQNSDSFWNGTEFVNLRVSFPVQELHARLHLAISNRVKAHDRQQTLQTDFTVRGFPENKEYSIEAWFKSARDHIREKFVSMFTEDIQTRVWERKS